MANKLNMIGIIFFGFLVSCNNSANSSSESDNKKIQPETSISDALTKKVIKSVNDNIKDLMSTDQVEVLETDLSGHEINSVKKTQEGQVESLKVVNFGKLTAGQSFRKVPHLCTSKVIFDSQEEITAVNTDCEPIED
jgi:hypothetical protein